MVCLQVLEQLVKREFGSDAHSQLMSCVRIRGGYFELCKEINWSDDNWDVFSRVRPSLVSVK